MSGSRAITAGMPTGTGLQRFADHFPTRFHDVGIAEQHAVTMAAGLALGGMRPVVALYSTFSQRAFDGLVHDVCQNDLPVLLGLDRSGLVGEDGTSHQGMFMLPAMRSLPNLAIGSPKDEQELRDLVVTALAHDGPMALLYPRDAGEDLPDREGRGARRSAGARCCVTGGDLLLVGFGPIVQRLLRGRRCARRRWPRRHRHQRPLGEAARRGAHRRARRRQAAGRHRRGVAPPMGGFGDGVLDALNRAGIRVPLHKVALTRASWTTAPSTTCGASSGSTPRGILGRSARRSVPPRRGSRPPLKVAAACCGRCRASEPAGGSIAD